MAPSEIVELSARALASGIRQGNVSAEQAIEAVLARAEEVQPHLNCFQWLDRDSALLEARKADRDLSHGIVRGPLRGVHKDMFDRNGRPPSCGSRIRREAHTVRTATALARLDAAGAIPFGTLAMSEFAYGPTGHNAHFGCCANPRDTRHVSGGSSSGAGASVAARASDWHLPTTHVIAAEAAFIHRHDLASQPHAYSEQVRTPLQIGQKVSVAAYLEALQFRRRAILEFTNRVFDSADVFHAPTLPIRTPTIHESDVGGSSAMAPRIASLTLFTRLFNFLGLPVIALPAGFTAASATAERLPIGMQLAGAAFAEAELLRVAHVYQRATGWHLAQPPCSTSRSSS